MKRCVNIDWLEIFVLEPAERELSAGFFMREGFAVNIRAYGTPQYAEMFTLYRDGEQFLEIRRNPLSKKSKGGILHDRACHIRLTNNTCYKQSPINLLRTFLVKFNYTLKGITRIDICLDFQYFDYHQNPETFLASYLARKIAKINQCTVKAIGKDNFYEMKFNYAAWGSKTSMISTKMYNKTLEIADVHDKPYIRQSWYECGLTQDIDNTENKQIWRVEFSIKSDAKKWLKLDNELHEPTRTFFAMNNLLMYDNRQKLLSVFMSLQDHYFHFRYLENDEKGKTKRKDRCKRVNLFRLNPNDEIYIPSKMTLSKIPTRTDKMLINRCRKIEADVSLPVWAKESAEKLRILLAEEVAELNRLNNNTILSDYYNKSTELSAQEMKRIYEKLMIESAQFNAK